MRRIPAMTIALLLAGGAIAAEPARLNDVQAVGTHNSYKRPMPPDELAAHRARDPRHADSLDYGHRPIAEQLDHGMRAIELDVYDDPQGGRWLHPPGAWRKGYATPPWSAADAQAMARPGLKVMHLADIDFRSSCVTFVACLTIVREWSDAHPRHAPILITINAKDSGLGPGSPQPLPFDAAALDRIDAEIRSVLTGGKLITPDEVQGNHATLREAVRANAWPTLDASRGRVFVALDEPPEKVAAYRGKRRSLEGRAMFVASEESSPFGAFLILNDPIADAPRIARAVADGYVVRTRADADTREARRNDSARRDAAFASGAQYVSTDYYEPDARWSDYRVALPGGGAARCNPRRTAHCDGTAIEP